MALLQNETLLESGPISFVLILNKYVLSYVQNGQA